MGDTIPQLLIPPMPILPHALSMLGPCNSNTRASVLSERLFSKADEVVAARISNIKPKNVDMILFLNKHLLCFGIVQRFIDFFLVWGRGAVSYGIVSYCIGIPC